MAPAFAGLSASQYHSWRGAAEFHRFEASIIAPQVTESAAARVLDLGCGTGTWTRIAATLLPSARITGIDIDAEMVQFAARASAGDRITYAVADCCTLGSRGAFDLVICGMSADYIGFDCVAGAIADNLATDGSALVWVLDPAAYEVQGNSRIKRWKIEGNDFYTTAPIFDPDEVRSAFDKDGLRVTVAAHPFALSDQRQRTLLVYSARRTG